MGLFTRKSSVSLYELCHNFYNQVVFNKKQMEVFTNLNFKLITAADSRFSCIDPVLFAYELKVIHLELFGLAFIHSADFLEFVFAQAVITKGYLQKTNQLPMWDCMELYNKAIASSSIHGIDKTSSAKKERIEFLNNLRLFYYNKWTEKGLESNCVAHATNYFGSPLRWDGTPLPHFISNVFLFRLGFIEGNNELNKEALFRLQAIMFGLFDGARYVINTSKIKESVEETTADLINRVFDSAFETNDNVTFETANLIASKAATNIAPYTARANTRHFIIDELKRNKNNLENVKSIYAQAVYVCPDKVSYSETDLNKHTAAMDSLTIALKTLIGSYRSGNYTHAARKQTIECCIATCNFYKFSAEAYLKAVYCSQLDCNFGYIPPNILLKQIAAQARVRATSYLRIASECLTQINSSSVPLKENTEH